MKLSLHDLAKTKGWQAADFSRIFGGQDSPITIIGNDLKDV